MWENYFQDRQIKESHISLVSLKIEKENKFLGHFFFNIKFNRKKKILLKIKHGL